MLDRKCYYKAGYPSSRKLSGTLLAQFAVIVSVTLLTMAFTAPAQAQQSSVVAQYGDEEWTIDYSFSGNISSVRIDPEFNSLVFGIATSQDSDQELTLSLPRDLIDARINDIDSEFLVVASGQNIAYSETQNTDSMRQIRISIPEGATEFEVVGTRVMPEFPAILTAAIAGALMIAVVVMGRSLWHPRRYMQ